MTQNIVSSETKNKPQATFLKDYTPPPYLIDTVELHFDLDPVATRVRSRMQLRKNPAGAGGALVLDGEELKLISVVVDGKPVLETRSGVKESLSSTVGDPSVRWDDGGLGRLVIEQIPDTFVLEIETEINPSANSQLMGLYMSGGIFCTQCEALGFRRITYFLDRPDVMATYRCSIVADKAQFPVLLANGNLIAQHELPNGKHSATWEDPFKKPSYLFAMVAGKLSHISDHFVTCSGRRVDLYIYVAEQHVPKVAHAMAALKKAMKWDEDVYGREYDLDIFMIVGVDDFNFGAMENKGLNVFNTSRLLADPGTATDADYDGVEAVIAHEYFHNWSGDRVTCRDWFQICLKEGFTVFRDQGFTADMTSASVKRIDDVRFLRARQFPEDAGPMAHPIQPKSFITIENFYTLTVYEKGAEVIRMLHTLLGGAGFRKGSDLYFQRHDGQAVTCQDFVAAMADANKVDLTDFGRWYDQAGTPVLDVTHSYDAKAQSLTLSITQRGDAERAYGPVHMPLAVGIVGPNGKDLFATRILELRKARHQFIFWNVPAGSVPSVLRNFSAPVKMNIDLSDEQRLFLMAHDSDDFNRWEAGQQVAVGILLAEISRHSRESGNPDPRMGQYISAFKRVLTDRSLDQRFAAMALTLPAESYLAEMLTVIDPLAVHQAREGLRHALALACRSEFLEVYRENLPKAAFAYMQDQVGRRALKNICLAYIVETGEATALQIAVDQYHSADNMTDALSALRAVVNFKGEGGAAKSSELLAHFYQRWQHEALVVNTWFALQAAADVPDVLEQTRRLTQHPAFDFKNPNKVRSLISAFTGNPGAFHALDGSGYQFVTDQIILLNETNRKLAAGLARGFSAYKRYSAERQAQIKPQLERILALPGISNDLYEVVGKIVG